MNLVIDIGNTRTKFYIFNRGELAVSVPVDEFKPEYIDLLKNEYPQLDQAIISAVKKYPEEIKALLKRNFDIFIELDYKTPLPIQNNYKSRETLGNDRIATAVGANFLYPDSNLLIIDAGSAITFDFISEKGVFLGGNISPGINMRFNALNNFTGNLPLVGLEDTDILFGNTTETAIRAGVQNGIIYEVDNTISLFKEFYKNLKVIITGGDANFFDKKLKNSFFVNFNLTGIGLNRILEYN
ncbi:MAG: type III pantothenate kinase, partial [Prolixibacteraceae bacterium]|nr:type III pantothenate kinase [Prolixibacteraceae bacterium]